MAGRWTGTFLMSLNLRLTKHQLADLKQICELETGRLAKVQSKLGELQRPTLRPQDLLTEVGTILGEDTEPIVRQLLSLQGLIRQTGLPSEEVIAGIRDAVGRQGREVALESSAWEAVESTVKALVESQSVRLAARAIELAYDYANLLRRTKVLTDIRPLFNEAADEIEGAVVSYTLRLRYDSADGEHELSIALDESDIKMLAAQCDRALRKAATARSMVAETCNLPVVVSGEENDD
jgi:hypothetical protein